MGGTAQFVAGPAVEVREEADVPGSYRSVGPAGDEQADDPAQRPARQPAQRADAGGMAANRTNPVPVGHDESAGAGGTGTAANADDHELLREPGQTEDRAGTDHRRPRRTGGHARRSDGSRRKGRNQLVKGPALSVGHIVVEAGLQTGLGP